MMEDDYRSDSTGAVYCEGCGRVIRSTSIYLDGYRYCPQCSRRYEALHNAPSDAGEE